MQWRPRLRRPAAAARGRPRHARAASLGRPRSRILAVLMRVLNVLLDVLRGDPLPVEVVLANIVGKRVVLFLSLT